MNSIMHAKEYLHDNNLKMVVIRDLEVLAKSTDRGIKPIYDVYTRDNNLLKDSYVADRVIGKAAAIFLINGGIRGLYTDLISEVAIEEFSGTDIKVEYETKVPFILNREGNDLCPIENIAKNSKDVDELIAGINEFFIKVGMIKK